MDVVVCKACCGWGVVLVLVLVVVAHVVSTFE